MSPGSPEVIVPQGGMSHIGLHHVDAAVTDIYYQNKKKQEFLIITGG